MVPFPVEEQLKEPQEPPPPPPRSPRPPPPPRPHLSLAIFEARSGMGRPQQCRGWEAGREAGIMLWVAAVEASTVSPTSHMPDESS